MYFFFIALKIFPTENNPEIPSALAAVIKQVIKHKTCHKTTPPNYTSEATHKSEHSALRGK